MKLDNTSILNIKSDIWFYRNTIRVGLTCVRTYYTLIIEKILYKYILHKKINNTFNYTSFVFISSVIVESGATVGDDKQPKCNTAEHSGPTFATAG